MKNSNPYKIIQGSGFWLVVKDGRQIAKFKSHKRARKDADWLNEMYGRLQMTAADRGQNQ
jgi:hypothetical protein